MIFLTPFGCAYKLSSQFDALPGDVRLIYVPVFKNKSAEPGVEVQFTQALKKEILNSKAVQLVDSESAADAVLVGTIQNMTLFSDDGIIEAQDTKYLPANTVIATLTTITIITNLTLKRKNSSEVLWTSEFKQARTYTPPQVTLPVVNSVNSLYNLSARQQTIDIIAKEMMQLGFDRLVDRF